MRFSVQYLPLRKLKPDFSVRMTDRMKTVRHVIWDCMHLMAVRKNKNGNYLIISGQDRYEYLIKHTNKKYAPCIIDDSKSSSGVLSWLSRIRNRPLPLPPHFQHMTPERLAPKSRSIIRQFLRQEPRFIRLSRSQQIKVLLLAIRYKKTVVSTMKAKVDELLNP